MKNVMIGFVLGALATAVVFTLFEDKTETIDSTKGSQIQDETPQSQSPISEDSQLATTNTEQPSSTLANQVTDTESKQASRDSSTNGFGVMSDHAQKVLLEMDLRDARHKFRKIIPRNSPRLDSLLTATQNKLEQELALMAESPEGFSLEDSFDDDGNFRAPSLSPEEAEALRQREESRSARTERIRQGFEDSMRNLLSDEEIIAFRQQELTSANNNFQRMLGFTVDHLEESIPDLNDYQFSEIQRLAASVPDLSLDDVPFGSQMGTHAMHSNDYDDESTLMQFYQEVEQLLSPTQLEDWRGKPLVYQSAQVLVED